MLTITSYQLQTSLPDRPSSSSQTRSKNASSTALRKAAYAERDRFRSIDPGALDFAAEEDEEEEGLDDGDEDFAKLDAGDRGRQQALRILQAQSEIPGPEMWRSLAT